MSDKRKSVGPIKRPSRANVPTVRPKRAEPAAPAAPHGATPAAREADLLARLSRAEEELGAMLRRLTRTEERAQAAEATAAASSDARVRKLIAERDVLKSAMREAATVLLRALKSGERTAPPPLPSTVDVSEIAEMVESLRPPPDRT